MMKQEFEKLWSQISATGDSGHEFQFLCDSYSQPERFYHNLNHIESCLKDFREVSNLTNNPELVELAIWYHDVIYDVHQPDNEQKSAEAALAACSRAGIGSESGQKVYDLILSTKHDKAPGIVEQKIIIDVDLAILGKPSLEYDIYEKAIRKEYSYVSEDDFRKGRTAILRTFLERPSIYSLEFFESKYRQQAIQNIQRAISDLL